MYCDFICNAENYSNSFNNKLNAVNFLNILFHLFVLFINHIHVQKLSLCIESQLHRLTKEMLCHYNI